VVGVNTRLSGLLAARVGLLFAVAVAVAAVVMTAVAQPATLPDLLGEIETRLRETLVFAWIGFVVLAAWVAPFDRLRYRVAFAVGAWTVASLVIGILGSVFRNAGRRVEYGTPLEPLDILLEGVAYGIASSLSTVTSGLAVAIAYVLVARFGGVSTE
jgi:multidrug efflux pump subunit AcrA (membrane-fusion protein)